MSKKFSIVKTIDLDKLNNEIDEYIMQTGETSPHIYMHIDTMQAIDRAFPTNFTEAIRISDCQCTIGYWEGYQMLTDNNLEFGEVEIRGRSECKHEWHMVGSVAGTKVRYDVFVCSKCGKQQTRRTSFDKDGYKVTIVDFDDE